MKDKIMSAMQAFSKAMFMPVLILPIAGLLIAVGNVLTNARLLEMAPFLNNPVTTGFGTILSGALVAVSYTHLDVYKRQVLSRSTVKSFRIPIAFP